MKMREKKLTNNNYSNDDQDDDDQEKKAITVHCVCKCVLNKVKKTKPNQTSIQIWMISNKDKKHWKEIIYVYVDWPKRP